MINYRIGLLVFYLKLYDEIMPDEKTNKVKEFSKTIKKEYEKRGIEVIVSPVCRLKSEFAKAVKEFERQNVDAVISLHLAYSPSLESINVIAKTKLPLIILDTTPDYDFGFSTDASRIMFNHGIHGVQDFCNLLIRHDKNFSLEAGHWKKSDVIDRTIAHIKGCKAAKLMKNSRVGIVGKPFKGMGDFNIPFKTLKEKIGFNIVSATSNEIAKFMPSAKSAEIKKEVSHDYKIFKKGDFKEANLAKTEQSGLALRKWVEQKNLDAVTVNFQNITGAPGLPVVPFLEISKQMSKGIGYGGEGDVTTAVLCSALMKIIPETTFTEMFCPDWKGDRIFMSHMGEININLTGKKPVLEQRPYPFSKADDPIIASGCLKGGKGFIVNLAPGKNDTFTLITAPVEVCNTKGQEKVNGGIRGWIKPQKPVENFLKEYSLYGGTHHLVLSYGREERIFTSFANCMGWKYKTII